MGNRFSRKRDTPANSGDNAASEQKTAEEPAVAQPAEETEITWTQEAAETENLDEVVGESLSPVACLSNEECVAVYKEIEAPDDGESERVPMEAPAPAQPKLLVSTSKTSSSESEPVAEPKPVTEAQLDIEPAPEPVPQPEAEVEAVPEPVSESLPVSTEAETAVEQQIGKPAKESLIDLGVPGVTPQPVDIPLSSAPISDPVNADEPSENPVTEECQGSAEAAEICMSELEKCEESSESLEKPVEVETAENLEQLVSNANEESISGLLQNLELKGNDLIPSDVKIPDDTPITDTSTSIDLI